MYCNAMQCLIPVDYATHVHLQVAVISQHPLLHLDQINRCVVEGEETHAALEGLECIGAGMAIRPSRAAWRGRKHPRRRGIGS